MSWALGQELIGTPSGSIVSLIGGVASLVMAIVIGGRFRDRAMGEIIDDCE